jgi:hypothetical protein
MKSFISEYVQLGIPQPKAVQLYCGSIGQSKEWGSINRSDVVLGDPLVNKSIGILTTIGYALANKVIVDGPKAIGLVPQHQELRRLAQYAGIYMQENNLQVYGPEILAIASTVGYIQSVTTKPNFQQAFISSQPGDESEHLIQLANDLHEYMFGNVQV